LITDTAPQIIPSDPGGNRAVLHTKQLQAAALLHFAVQLYPHFKLVQPIFDASYVTTAPSFLYEKALRSIGSVSVSISVYSFRSEYNLCSNNNNNKYKT